MLFHGGHFGSHDAADCAEDWSLNFDGLAQWFHVVAVDKIGQGFTDNPKSDEDYTMAAVVQHAYDFLKRWDCASSTRSAIPAATIWSRGWYSSIPAFYELYSRRYQHLGAGASARTKRSWPTRRCRV